jgi:hypothetical protein
MESRISRYFGFQIKNSTFNLFSFKMIIYTELAQIRNKFILRIIYSFEYEI